MLASKHSSMYKLKACKDIYIVIQHIKIHLHVIPIVIACVFPSFKLKRDKKLMQLCYINRVHMLKLTYAYFNVAVHLAATNQLSTFTRAAISIDSWKNVWIVLHFFCPLVLSKYRTYKA